MTPIAHYLGLALLTAACGITARGAAVRETTADHVVGCENLGDVAGSTLLKTDEGVGDARDEVRNAAAQLGATDVVYGPRVTKAEGGFDLPGQAYRCGPPDGGTAG